jgi:acyl transferase domain-containing protein
MNLIHNTCYNPSAIKKLQLGYLTACESVQTQLTIAYNYLKDIIASTTRKATDPASTTETDPATTTAMTVEPTVDTYDTFIDIINSQLNDDDVSRKYKEYLTVLDTTRTNFFDELEKHCKARAIQEGGRRKSSRGESSPKLNEQRQKLVAEQALTTSETEAVNNLLRQIKQYDKTTSSSTQQYKTEIKALEDSLEKIKEQSDLKLAIIQYNRCPEIDEKLKELTKTQKVKTTKKIDDEIKKLEKERLELKCGEEQNDEDINRLKELLATPTNALKKDQKAELADLQIKYKESSIYLPIVYENLTIQFSDTQKLVAIKAQLDKLVQAAKDIKTLPSNEFAEKYSKSASSPLKFNPELIQSIKDLKGLTDKIEQLQKDKAVAENNLSEKQKSIAIKVNQVLIQMTIATEQNYWDVLAVTTETKNEMNPILELVGGSKRKKTRRGRKKNDSNSSKPFITKKYRK